MTMINETHDANLRSWVASANAAGTDFPVQNLPFGGTAVLIMVGVGLDTMKQINSQLMQRKYEGFLK